MKVVISERLKLSSYGECLLILVVLQEKAQSKNSEASRINYRIRCILMIFIHQKTLVMSCVSYVSSKNVQIRCERKMSKYNGRSRDKRDESSWASICRHLITNTNNILIETTQKKLLSMLECNKMLNMRY